jgi:hypothetical protein
VLRIEQPALDAVLERVEHRLPVHARRFHPDECYAEFFEPITELDQVARDRGERLRLLAATLAIRNANRRNDRFAVYVESGAPLDNLIPWDALFESRCAPVFMNESA